ncbi:MAG: RidA family protein [Acetobacteraceae bacterium]|nr:RidA family protein [Acetobacteraceae bacterium]
MPIRFSNPEGAPKPVGRYHMAAEVPPGMKLIAVSGQVGVGMDGNVVEDPAGQIAQAFANLVAVLKGLGAGPRDIVKINVFLTDPALIPLMREKRQAALGDAVPASTLLIVAGLAAPAYKIEVECTAAVAA